MQLYITCPFEPTLCNFSVALSASSDAFDFHFMDCKFKPLFCSYCNVNETFQGNENLNKHYNNECVDFP